MLLRRLLAMVAPRVLGPREKILSYDGIGYTRTTTPPAWREHSSGRSRAAAAQQSAILAGFYRAHVLHSALLYRTTNHYYAANRREDVK